MSCLSWFSFTLSLIRDVYKSLIWLGTRKKKTYCNLVTILGGRFQTIEWYIGIAKLLYNSTTSGKNWFLVLSYIRDICLCIHRAIGKCKYLIIYALWSGIFYFFFNPRKMEIKMRALFLVALLKQMHGKSFWLRRSLFLVLILLAVSNQCVYTYETKSQ